MLWRLADEGQDIDEARREYLESLIRADYERARPDDALEDLRRRARFSRPDKALLRDWMAVAARRAAADAQPIPPARS